MYLLVLDTGVKSKDRDAVIKRALNTITSSRTQLKIEKDTETGFYKAHGTIDLHVIIVIGRIEEPNYYYYKNHTLEVAHDYALIELESTDILNLAREVNFLEK